MEQFKFQFKVVCGIFEGHEFMGHICFINGEIRVWDDESVGRSYPAGNCRKV